MPQAAAGNQIFGLIPMVLIFVIFYFLMIQPQRREQKRHQEMLKKLSKNDEVVTSSGIHGTIVNVKDKTVIVRIDENVKIELEKNSISYVKNTQEAAAKG